MSLIQIKSVFQNLHTGTNWSLQLLNIKSSKRTGINYSSRQITLSPENRFYDFLNDIIRIYTGNGKKSLDLIENVREYDGTADSLTIYKLSAEDTLISSAYATLMQQIAAPNVEDDPFQYDSAHLLKGQIMLSGQNTSIKLFSMQNPITLLKNKFFWSNGSFQEANEKFLFLRPTVDLLIIDRTVYLLTLAGETLFNMARAYKNVCHQKVESIVQADILNTTELFMSVAESGHNPRKFVSFSDDRLTALHSVEIRNSIAARFSIPLDAANGKFDVSTDDAANKIIKLLCNKGMTDPFNESAVEVSSARQWQ